MISYLVEYKVSWITIELQCSFLSKKTFLIATNLGIALHFKKSFTSIKFILRDY